MPGPTDGSDRSVFDLPMPQRSPLVLPSPKRRCFVLMPFSKQFDLVWHYGILRPFQGELAESWECTRADEWGPGQIMGQVYEHIRESHAILADLTGANANVYYELGYAHAVGHRAMLITQDPLEGLPFDLSGYRVFWYEATTRGLETLNDQIVAWLQADLWSTQGTPHFGLEPIGVVTADGVPFALKNTGTGVATDVKVTLGKWVVAYGQPIAPGYVSHLLIPHDWEFTKLLAEDKPLPGPLQVEYRDADGTPHKQEWDVTPVRNAKGVFSTDVQQLK